MAVLSVCDSQRRGVAGAAMTEYCKQCGSVQMRWPDIAQAMEEMIDVAPNGVKPLFRQAIDEIRELRKRELSVNGPRPYFPYPMKYTFRDENCDDLYRDAMRYRQMMRDPDVMICPNLIQGTAGMPCPKCGEGPCKVVGHGVGL